MKRNLLDECNDQRIPPRDFEATFCKRCRNRDCSLAGWASSSFEERVNTQVDRLLVSPYQARPEDTRFDPLRALLFKEIPADVALARLADPWAGPKVHLASPPTSVATNQVVEDAVSRLAETTGRKPPEPVPPAVEPPPPAPSPSPVPDPPTGINTEFPDEGVMIGGGPVPPLHRPEADPWTPKAKVNVVPRGAKIRMGG
jgi:hypothetical protein